MSSPTADETQRLLPRPKNEKKYKDPLTLTRSERWCILTAIWLAQCFAVGHLL